MKKIIILSFLCLFLVGCAKRYTVQVTTNHRGHNYIKRWDADEIDGEMKIKLWIYDSKKGTQNEFESESIIIKFKEEGK